MIKSIPSDNHNEFYENEYINALVDLSLDNLDDNIFFCILHVIQYGNLTFAVEIIDEFKLESSQKDSYDYLKTIVQSIYEDEINKDNLRGAYLELLVYKFLNNKYSNYSCYRSDLDCYVEIFGNRSDRTVDVFAFWLNEGFVSENKISERFFEEHDIENLNWIYTESNHYLKPYIITLAPNKYIRDKLYNLTCVSTNIYVNWANIKILSIDNLLNFFTSY